VFGVFRTAVALFSGPRQYDCQRIVPDCCSIHSGKEERICAVSSTTPFGRRFWNNVSLVDEQLAGKGVRLRKLIDIAGPGHGCKYMTVESADGEFAASLPLGEISRTAVLIYESGGKPLEREGGGPVRFVVPHHPDRCVNVKGLGRILVSREPGRDTRPSQQDSKAGAKA